ncbi:hypothetical protein YC2023_020406 [Brassica napus]
MATCRWLREECCSDASERQRVFFKQLGGDSYCYHDDMKMLGYDLCCDVLLTKISSNLSFCNLQDKTRQCGLSFKTR